jgi:hypothetical protein
MTDHDLDIGRQVLLPLLEIRGLTWTDHEVIERLIREANAAYAGLAADPSDDVRADLYIERMQRLLAQAQTIMTKYADE